MPMEYFEENLAWLEGGLCASYEKFVMDCETLQQIIAYLGEQPDRQAALEKVRAYKAKYGV